MKKYLLAIAIVAALYFGWDQTRRPEQLPTPATVADDTVASAFREQRSGVQVTGEGVVAKVLSDDNNGDRHQRFILSLASGQSVLVAHNIDVAPRLATLAKGDSVAFKGVYEWNAKGGLIHWTHHDPGGQHPGGWLKHNGKTYQ
jgi:hypothetical protein